MSIATMTEFAEFLRGDDMDDRDIIDRWHLACIEWGKGSRGGFPRGVTAPGDDEPAYSKTAWRHVEQALCQLGPNSPNRRIIKRYYTSDMWEWTTGEIALAEWLHWHFNGFRTPDGMSDAERARRWLDRALLTLEGVAPLPESV